MPHTVTEVILNLKNVILQFAAAKNHTHSEYVQQNSGDYAPKVHNWSQNTNKDYGTASSGVYGHVKKASSITDDPDSVPSNQAVNNFVTNSITNIYNQIIERFEGNPEEGGNGIIQDIISQYDFDSRLKRYSIAATYQKPNVYPVDEQFGIFEQKVQDDDGVDKYTWAGHYQIVPDTTQNTFDENNFKITYGQLYKYYVNGLLDVRRSGNMVIQELYTTTLNANGTYVLSGEKYTRTGILDHADNPTTVTWNNWLAAFIPYSASEITLDIEETGINNMSLKETTAGYIIEWENQGAYELQSPANVAKTIATFDKSLHIGEGEHIFPNHLGAYQISITKNDIKLTSNKQLGANIDDAFLNQTYFIPRTG